MADESEQKQVNEVLQKIQEVFGKNVLRAVHETRAKEDKSKVKGIPGERADAKWLAEELSALLPPDEIVADDTARNWIRGKSIPRTPQLIALAMLFGKSLDSLLGVDLSSINAELRPPVSIIKDKEKYKAAREEVIKGTQKELWIQLRTTPALIEISQTLLSLLDPPTSIALRLLVCNPRDNHIRTMISRRKYPWFSRTENPTNEMILSLNRWLDSAQIANIKIRVINYLPSTAMYISDPDSDSGKLFAVTANYKIDPYLAPCVIASKRDHPTVFEAYHEQFRLLWDDGDPYQRAVSKKKSNG